ncbi:hypothetical protein XAB3213_5090002 [Xanthomonas citri pv. bilvae]|nr:hypothetical protein XAB3213_5090002 [Xanthomonas citri pv. bilvae]
MGQQNYTANASSRVGRIRVKHSHTSELTPCQKRILMTPCRPSCRATAARASPGQHGEPQFGVHLALHVGDVSGPTYGAAHGAPKRAPVA